MIENVSFNIPNEVTKMLINGDAIRYGGVIRNNSGKILYHLRETSSFTENIGLLNNIIPHTGEAVKVFSNLTPGVNMAMSVIKIAQEHKTHKMLGEIQTKLINIESVLKSVQMFSAVGMASSLITLGVVAASFYVLNKKLNNITSSLNDINIQLANINNKLDIIDSFLKDSIFSDLKYSIQTLEQSKFISNEKEKREHILNVAKDFKRCKFKFENVLEKVDPNKFEIYDRFYKGLSLSIIGEIQSNLNTNEFALALDNIKYGVEMLNQFKSIFPTQNILNNKLDELSKKVGGKSAILGDNRIQEKRIFIEKSVKTEELVLKEIIERVDSFKYEVETINKNKINYEDWKNLSLDDDDNSGLIFIKA